MTLKALFGIASFFCTSISIINTSLMKKIQLLFCVALCTLWHVSIRGPTLTQSPFHYPDREFYRGDLGGIWEALRKGREAELPVWEPVSIPHSYNAFDAVDPEIPYYQGPAWYRILLQVENPYPDGRTLLHFEGAGQKTEVYVCDRLAGEHTGGYDEFTVDLTAILEELPDSMPGSFGRRIPVSIRTDNSRDLEMIPSDLSDFNLYGGLYRYVNLVYVPEVSVKSMQISPILSDDRQRAEIGVTLHLYNPDPRRRLSLSHFESGNLAIVWFSAPTGRYRRKDPNTGFPYPSRGSNSGPPTIRRSTGVN